MEDILEAQAQGSTIHLRVVQSRLDAAAAPRFKQKLASVWQDGLLRAEVDMSSVEFIDSSGVGALLSAYRRLPEATASVALHGMRPQVQAVIELLRLHRIFRIA